MLTESQTLPLPDTRAGAKGLIGQDATSPNRSRTGRSRSRAITYKYGMDRKAPSLCGRSRRATRARAGAVGAAADVDDIEWMVLAMASWACAPPPRESERVPRTSGVWQEQAGTEQEHVRDSGTRIMDVQSVRVVR